MTNSKEVRLNPSEIAEFIIEPNRVRIMSHRGTCMHDIPACSISEGLDAVKRAVHGWAKWKHCRQSAGSAPRTNDLRVGEQ
jgi:hypothetical protein